MAMEFNLQRFADGINISVSLKHRPKPLPVGVTILRHGEKNGPFGWLTANGLRQAVTQGEQSGEEWATSGVHNVIIKTSPMERVKDTASAFAHGVKVGGRRSRNSRLEVKTIEDNPMLSLSAIEDGKESVFVQKYLNALKEAEEGSQIGKEKRKESAAGQVLLEWLSLDDKRMKLPDGTEDPHTRSAREIAQQQAFLLRQSIEQAIQSNENGDPTQVELFSHENMVLVWARYFLYQQKTRRGKLERIIDGTEIVEKIKGKIPYLGKISIKFFKEEDGNIRVRAWFNHARYEVDMEMVDSLAQEAQEMNEGGEIGERINVIRRSKPEREKIYLQRGLAA